MAAPPRSITCRTRWCFICRRARRPKGRGAHHQWGSMPPTRYRSNMSLFCVHFHLFLEGLIYLKCTSYPLAWVFFLTLRVFLLPYARGVWMSRCEWGDFWNLWGGHLPGLWLQGIDFTVALWWFQHVTTVHFHHFHPYLGGWQTAPIFWAKGHQSVDP